MHVVAHSQGVTHFVQNETVEGLPDEFGVFFVGEVVGAHGRRGEQAVAPHDCAGMATAHLLGDDFARGAMLQFSVKLGVLFVHGVFDHARFREDLGAPQAADHPPIFEHDVGPENLTGAWVHEARPISRERGCG